MLLRRQILQSAARRIATLGQEAADVLAGITKADSVLLDTGPGYGVSREIVVDGHRIEWLALTHPGNRSPAWARRHSEWARSVRG